MRVIKTISLTQGKTALVDDENFERLNQWKWHALKKGNTYYAARQPSRKNGKRLPIYMHNSIINVPLGFICDHINHNGLDNQQCNLRVVTKRQNAQNLCIKKTSQYPGVCWNKKDKKWRAKIVINGTQILIGLYDFELDAFNAYRQYVESIGETVLEQNGKE